MDLLAVSAERAVSIAGAACFGIVIGWFTYFVMRRSQPKRITDIGLLIGAVGGGAILSLYDKKGPLFGAYAIGLLGGATLYFFVFGKVVGWSQLKDWVTGKNGPPIMGTERNKPGDKRR
jgi:hypothetical protein